MPPLDVVLQLGLVRELPPAIFDRTDELFLRHVVQQHVDEGARFHHLCDLPSRFGEHLVAVPAQAHQAGLHISHQLGVQVFVPAFDDGGQGLESDCDNIEVIVIALVEDGNDTRNDGFFVGLPECNGAYLKLLSVMRLESTPRQ